MQDTCSLKTYETSDKFIAQTSEPAYKVKLVVRQVFKVTGEKALDKRGTVEISLTPTLDEFREIFKSQLIHALKYILFTQSYKLDKRAIFEDLTENDTSNNEWKQEFEKKIIFSHIYLSLKDIKDNSSISEHELNERFKNNKLEIHNLEKTFFVVVKWPHVKTLEHVEHWYSITMSEK